MLSRRGARLQETLAIATERNLTAYDAAYLELAMREGAQLATLDGDLRRAATEAGVRVI
ncbi:MAG: type II toxin-antitoxin system VapC family toxin [Acidobacteria bacterium]|nr:type II toxin-antitoxin system VapC family toxin [Acidobacteriota bacterium]